MGLFTIITILVVITAVFAYLNSRFLKLPETIGVMIISLVFSLLLILSGLIFPGVTTFAKDFIGNVDFSHYFEIYLRGGFTRRAQVAA